MPKRKADEAEITEDNVMEEVTTTGKVPKTKKKRFDHTELAKQVTSECEVPFELQNVVATFSLGVDNLSLKTLCLQKPFMEYNPVKFAASTVRIREPRTTALIFASGNMVVTGARTELASRLAARKYTRLLQKHMVPVSFRNFAIQNIVASADVGYAIRLKELARAYGVFCSYEPDLFPGLILRTTCPKLVFLMFRSGKIVITGGKTRDEIKSTFGVVYNGIIKNYLEQGAAIRSSAEYRVQMRQSILPPSVFDK